MTKGIYFKDVLKTIITHNGTKIEYAMPRAKQSIEVLTNNGVHKDGTNALFGFYAIKQKLLHLQKIVR